jgi:group I intron endonuclease
MKSGIYRIKNTINNKSYIGSTKNITKRWSWHRLALKKGVHHASHLQRAWNKYGEDSFVFEFLWATEPVPECLLYEEQLALNHMNCEYNTCKVAGATYGLTPWKGRKHTQETKDKIRQGNLNKKVSEASRKKMSEAKKGKKHSDEVRAKMSALRRGTGKGYSYNKRDALWRTYTLSNGRQISLGYFETEQEAASFVASHRAGLEK